MNESEILIGKRLSELRIENHLTQEELAERLDVSRQAISKWESDKAIPNIEKMLKISELYGVSVDFLLKGNASDLEAKEKITAVSEEQKEAGEKAGETAGRKIKETNLCIWFALFLTGVLCLFSLIIVGTLMWNHLFRTDNKIQGIMYVDSVYEQYTKADVIMQDSQGKDVRKTLWLDAKGIRENDWVQGYEAVDGKTVRIKTRYNIKTMLVPALFTIVFIIILTLLCMELRRRHEKRNME